MRRFLPLILGLSLFLSPLSAARAQGQSGVDLYPPDLSTFPSVSLLVDVFGQNGIFAPGLPRAFTVLEDGQPGRRMT
jgi:hypothetical protein